MTAVERLRRAAKNIGQALACSNRLKRYGMTVALLVGVMATVFRIRWRITVYFLELVLRVVLLSAFFTRSVVRRPRAEPVRALGVDPDFYDSSADDRLLDERIGHLAVVPEDRPGRLSHADYPELLVLAPNREKAEIGV